MNKASRIISSPYFLWFLLAIPWVIMSVRYLNGNIYYGEFIHETGEYSARLLIVTLALTPLRLAFPSSRLISWLMQRRRHFGVAAFAYAVPHLVAYLVKLGTLDKILEDGLQAGIWTGWIAMLIFLVLAWTSNDTSVRALGRRWKSLHRFVYIAAVFTFLHWLLVAFDPVPAAIHAGVLVLLETYRIWKSRANRSVATN